MTTSRSPATLLRRLIATLIDVILVPLFALVLMLVTGAFEHAEDYAGYRPWISALLLGVASYLCLNGWLLWRRGQTLGKAALGIGIVMQADAARVAMWRLICIRALFFPLLYLPLLAVVFTPWLLVIPLLDQGFIFLSARRCLHDYLCRTDVLAV
jgi:hypothetical protein